jgi:hypothetical protein
MVQIADGQRAAQVLDLAPSSGMPESLQQET